MGIIPDLRSTYVRLLLSADDADILRQLILLVMTGMIWIMIDEKLGILQPS